jgi:hypothetical protein
MPDIHDVMDVTIEELSPEQQLQLKDAIDQFQQKCLMSFAKNRSGVPYLKSDMPIVLLPGEPDTTSAEEKQEVMNAVQQTMENIMDKHNTAVLNMFRQMMVSRYVDGLITSVMMKGPSQGVESLCMPSVFWVRLRTRSPTLKEVSLTLRSW